MLHANPCGRADGNRKKRGSRSLTLERWAYQIFSGENYPNLDTDFL
jgi:hypothetical protein